MSTEDRTINPDLERFMAKRMGAKTIEVKASHLSLISQPETITRLILARPATRPISKSRIEEAAILSRGDRAR